MSVKTTPTAKAKTAKAKDAKAKTPKIKIVHGERVNDTELRKKIFKTVNGTASKNRKEGNRYHTVKIKDGKKVSVYNHQIIYGNEFKNHKQKNILEVINSKNSYYYFIVKK